ncbi:MAG: NADH-quinone oxidoreductase subunit L [Nitrospiraceae bacterium]|nr:NADH-quinone oxidoreductase subunit L [Nitrospiraceae bacterium]
MTANSLLLIPALPLLAFIINITLGKGIIKDKAHLVSIPALAASWAIAMLAVYNVFSRGNVFEGNLYTWVVSGAFRVQVGFLVDQLTAVMLVVVTSVGLLVNIYSAGYMRGDKGFYRFFAYLSLFVFSMLMLIMANNFLQLYFGWEAVGLCSYFLIGFWYEKKSAADAGKKAFIVNRFGDFGFGLGIMLIFLYTGSLQYSNVFPAAHSLAGQTVSLFGSNVPLPTVIALLLFCGAMGKSAQFPLHVWLPDAMEGPTPVSALIHAATMVTAGVFMVARCSPIFNLSPVAMGVVAITGAFTALFAATIALTQNDIKRVIAYSTISQLGYMFLACGVGAYGAGVFHLYTHGFFKALLFLGAGSVMHAMSGELDLRKMGGLKKYMPVTYWTFLLASLSISGIPGFAGFFSKDEILWRAYSSGPLGKVLWAVGVLTALLTAFYSFRLVFMAFHGKFRGSIEQERHLHESPMSMGLPLLILAVGAVAAGWVGISPVISESLGMGPLDKIGPFLATVVGTPVSTGAPTTELALMGVSVLMALLGILLAAYMYLWKPEAPEALARTFRLPYKLSFNKYYIDEIYDNAIVKPTFWVAKNVIVGVTDGKWIEGIVNGVPKAIGSFGQSLRKLQSGVTQHYADIMALGVLIFIAAALLLRL